MATDERRPVPRGGFALEEFDGELLLLHPTSERMIHCSPTAALVWRLCDGERTISEIVRLLVETYPDAAATIPADVADTLETLAREGALELK